MDKIQAIFLDRDGTIGGESESVAPGDFMLYDGAQEAINMLKEHGVLVCAFTNQMRIAAGLIDEKKLYDEFISFGFDKVYICPHAAAECCDCRKPNTGMLDRAAEESGLDLAKCVVVGDRWSDMLAAARVGATKILVKSGAWEEAYGRFRHKWQEHDADYIADDLLNAVKWLKDKGYLNA